MVAAIVMVDAGASTAEVGYRHNGSTTAITGVLTPAVVSGITDPVACANVGGTAITIEGHSVTCSSLSAINLTVGDYIETIGGTADGTTARMSIALTFTTPGGGGGGGGSCPSGASGQIQFSTGVACGGDANFLWDNTNKILNVGPNPSTLPAALQSAVGIAGIESVANAPEFAGGNSAIVGVNYATGFDEAHIGVFGIGATNQGGGAIVGVFGQGLALNGTGTGRPVDDLEAFFADGRASGVGGVLRLENYLSESNVDTGVNVSQLLGFYADAPFIVSGGTVTTVWGFYAAPQRLHPGSGITNSYAFFSEDQGTDPNAWSFYSVGGKNFFGGPVNLGSTESQAGSSSGVITFATQANAGTYNWEWPTTAGGAGQVLTSQGGGSTAMIWTTPPGAGGGANTGLSNLASVAINTSLLPGTAGSFNLGSATFPWAGLYLGSAANATAAFSASSTEI